MKRLLVFSFLVGIFLIPVASVYAEPRFRLPLAQTYNNPPVLYYYDNDSSSGWRSWQCQSNSYNKHTGTDFRTNQEIGKPVYAGAVGSLYYRVDSCPTYGYQGSSCGGYYGNHVKIAHTSPWNDSSNWVSLYAHLSEGWQNVRWLSSVMCGAWVGNSGSSGSSTGPHLHFETRHAGYPNDDPYAGSCSGPVSYWTNQNGGWPTTQCQ